MLDLVSVWRAISVLRNRFNMVFLSNMLSLNIYLLYWFALVHFLYKSFFNYKTFSQAFRGSTRTSLFVSSDTCKGKTAYILDLPRPRISDITLGVVVVVVVCWNRDLCE